MLENPGITIVYLAPTIAQVKRIGFYPMFLSNNPIIPTNLIKDINKTDMTVELINGSRIIFAGTESKEKLRGLTGDLLVLDEYSIMDADVFTDLQPVIARRNGRIVVAGTPIGMNHFYELCQKGILGTPEFTPGHRTWIIPITHKDVQVPYLEESIRNAQSILSPEAYAQEYLVSFTTASGLVYKSFDMYLNQSYKQLVVVDPNSNQNKALFIGLDFNTAKMVAVVAQEYTTDSGKEIHVVDEVVLYNTNTYKMAEELQRRYSQFKGRIFICPDASGKANKTSATETDHLILQKAGFKLLTDNSNPYINDRVNSVNSAFCSASGVRKLYVSHNCKETLKSLSSQTYDIKTNKPEKGSGATDISAAPDALGYLINQRMPLKGYGVTMTNALGYK